MRMRKSICPSYPIVQQANPKLVALKNNLLFLMVLWFGYFQSGIFHLKSFEELQADDSWYQGHLKDRLGWLLALLVGLLLSLELPSDHLHEVSL